ncbi:hypothetical protein [Gordonia sp. (in: high G+C Gram-positive bacteria)]|nr:hypothetical protein [Gordonia sp. (in: high G+C Gram-positive bacteria)]HMS76283.1 hypothetical protein [Gordonia sp. (in: high G+C Gram-positive bacteria)]HQV20501.1 hypothetical protein [Gordonia sp. (in: high G+C Gram-positive bacteria)]
MQIEYEELADSYEAEPPTRDEIDGPIVVDPSRLRTGGPANGNAV